MHYGRGSVSEWSQQPVSNQPIAHDSSRPRQNGFNATQAFPDSVSPVAHVRAGQILKNRGLFRADEGIASIRKGRRAERDALKDTTPKGR